MANSPLTDRVVLSITVALCLVAAVLMLALNVQSLVVDLVYQGF